MTHLSLNPYSSLSFGAWVNVYAALRRQRTAQAELGRSVGLAIDAGAELLILNRPGGLVEGEPLAEWRMPEALWQREAVEAAVEMWYEYVPHGRAWVYTGGRCDADGARRYIDPSNPAHVDQVMRDLEWIGPLFDGVVIDLASQGEITDKVIAKRNLDPAEKGKSTYALIDAWDASLHASGLIAIRESVPIARGDDGRYDFRHRMWDRPDTPVFTAIEPESYRTKVNGESWSPRPPGNVWVLARSEPAFTDDELSSMVRRGYKLLGGDFEQIKRVLRQEAVTT